MKKQVIYEHEYYLFENFTLTGVSKLLDSYEFDITIGLMTPEYAEVFKSAWFHLEVPILARMLAMADLPDPAQTREKFWKMFYEISERTSEDEEWEINARTLQNELGFLPSIKNLSIVADVDFFDYDLDNSLEFIEFNIVAEDYISNKTSRNFRENLVWTANEICILAQRTGYDLRHIWKKLNTLRDQKFVTNPKNIEKTAEMIHEVHMSLVRWNRPEVRLLEHEMLKHLDNLQK